MTIYTVQAGDTLYSMAEKFNVPYTRLKEQNAIMQNNDLVVGQNLVITYPDKVYYVQEGDTPESIANAFGTNVIQLLQFNPQISDRDFLYIGEEIVISYPKDDSKSIEVEGLTFSYINLDTLRKSLPYLTYLVIVNYRALPTGEISTPQDTEIVKTSRDYGVAPLMMLSTLEILRQGSFGTTSKIFNDQDTQDKLIENVFSVLKQHKLSGVSFAFQDILRQDLQNYIYFLTKIIPLLHNEGYLAFVSVIPSVFDYTSDTNIETYFAQIGKIADRVVLISYQRSREYIPTVRQTTARFMDDYLQYIVTEIPPEKILIGITRLAYDWELPYVEQESVVNSLTNHAAIELAYNTGVNIMFDEETITPYFYYTSQGVEHFVWFKDAKTIIGILDLVDKYNLKGVSIWNIMYFAPQTYAIIASSYNIVKLTELPPIQYED